MQVAVEREEFSSYNRQEDRAGFDLKGAISVDGADFFAVYMAAERAGVSMQEYLFTAAVEKATRERDAW